MSREGLVIEDFSGGLNNVQDPTLIAENEVAGLRNMIISRTGKLVSRYPMYKIADYVGDVTTVIPLGYYRDEEGVIYLVIATQNKTFLYDIVGDDWTEIWSTAAEDMTTYANRLYLISSTNSGGYWSKVASTYQWTSLNTGTHPMPNGNQIHYTKGRIYISSRADMGTTDNTSTIRYSNLSSTALATSIDQFPITNVIDVNEGDGEKLLKIVEGSNELFLFRSNSTYRLAFSASADPSLGALSLMSSSVGTDSPETVLESEGYVYVLHAGTLYQFAGYIFTPLNPSNKLEFRVKDAYEGLSVALSKLSDYILVWHYGYMYCFDRLTGMWSEWQSDTAGAYFIEAPRGTFLEASAVPTAYGVPGYGYATKGLLKFALEFTETSTERIRCSITTRTYDIGQPSRFKRLFGWELLVVATNWVKAALNPLDSLNVTELTWDDLEAYTWSGAASNGIMWNAIGAGVPELITGLPATNPLPQVLKVTGKRTFKRVYFTIQFENDGTSLTAPSRLDGIVLYILASKRVAIARVA